MNHVTHPLSSADINIFSTEISKFCYIKKYRFILHFDTYFLTLLAFFESQAFLKERYFEIKVMTLEFLSMTSATKF